MSRALKTVSPSVLSLAELNGLAPNRTLNPKQDLVSGESGLESELDRLLARRPAAKPSVSHLNSSPVALAENDDDSGDEGFTWEPIPVEKTARSVSATSAQWLQKARKDKRKSKWRNMAAWAATLAIGGAIISVTAYFLVGWRPNLEAVYSIASRWLL